MQGKKKKSSNVWPQKLKLMFPLGNRKSFLPALIGYGRNTAQYLLFFFLPIPRSQSSSTYCDLGNVVSLHALVRIVRTCWRDPRFVFGFFPHFLVVLRAGVLFFFIVRPVRKKLEKYWYTSEYNWHGGMLSLVGLIFLLIYFFYLMPKTTTK